MERRGVVDEYLRKSAQAESARKRAMSPLAKASWARISAGYLELAEMAKRRARKTRVLRL
jgi:hypothetical protein